MKKIKLFSMLAAALFCGGTLSYATSYIPLGVKTVTENTTIYCTDITTAGDPATDWVVVPNHGTSSVTYSNVTSDTEGNPTGITDNLASTSSAVAMIQIKADGNTYNSKNRVVHMHVTGVSSVIGHGAASSTNRGMAIACNEYFDGMSEATTVTAAVSVTRSTSGSFIVQLDGLQAEKEYIISFYAVTSDTRFYAAELIAGEASSDPWFSIAPAEVNLYQNPFMEEATETVTIKGANLEDGTYNLTLPTIEGLSVEPASVTVTDGALNETITLTYTSDADVEEGTAEVALTIGELTEKLAITYSAKVTLLEQTSVSEATTWDWSKASELTEIKLDANTNPAKDAVVLLANVDGIINDETFNSQALLIAGEYLVRKCNYGICCHAKSISFNAEKDGDVKVVFSNTADRTDEAYRRYLVVNGSQTEYSTMKQDEPTTAEVSVKKGAVEITFKEAAGINYCRVYSITYTPDNTTTSIESTTEVAPATKVVRDGQLLIIRDGKTYNAQGAFVR